MIVVIITVVIKGEVDFMSQSNSLPEQAKPPVHTSTLFQIIMMVITTAALALPVYKILSPLIYTPLDVRPELLPITPAITREFGRNPGIVKIGLLIQSFSIFNIIQDEFEFSGIIWFNFDPSVIPLSMIEKFSIGKGKFITQISSDVTKTQEGLL
jgi:hypothetical protein